MIYSPAIEKAFEIYENANCYDLLNHKRHHNFKFIFLNIIVQKGLLSEFFHFYKAVLSVILLNNSI